MAWKERTERAQNGYILSMTLFLILAPLGIFLDNEILITIGALMLLYLPSMAVVFLIWGVRDDFGKWKKKQRKAKRIKKLREAKVLVCRSCDKVYRRDELDLAPSGYPRCPTCNKILKIKE